METSMNNFSKWSGSIKSMFQAGRPAMSRHALLQERLDQQRAQAEREQTLMAQLLETSSELRKAEKARYECELALRQDISNLQLQAQTSHQIIRTLQEQIEDLQKQLAVANRRRYRLSRGLPQNASPQPARDSHSLRGLLALDDDDFIQQAYTLVLGREPDPDGRKYYSARLVRGVSRLQILGQLRLSAEGLQRQSNVQGLDAVIRLHRLLMQIFYPLVILMQALRRQALARRAAVKNADSIAQAIGGVNDPALMKQAASLEYERLSPRARNIYFQIKAADQAQRRA